MTIDDVIGTLDDWFPPVLAESWDNVGLLLGDRHGEVRRVMTCLTVTPESAGEAVREKTDLIVSHHPILFRATNRLTADGPEAAVYQLARAGVAVYSPHTAFDSAAEGINQQIAERLQLHDIRPLRPASGTEQFKLVVFVSESDLDSVQNAIFDAGGGIIGEYAECSYRLSGTGSFRGSEKSNPTVGERDRREEVAEHRLEVLVPKKHLSAVLAAMIRAHSYEEPAYDVYPLHPSPRKEGTGRWGRLGKPVPLAELAGRVKSELSANRVEVVGNGDRICKTVAIGCGAAAELLDDAHRLGCDVFLTGEARFHDYLRARASDVGLLLAGHYATERFAVERLAERIDRHWPKLTAWPSQDEKDPVEMVL